MKVLTQVKGEDGCDASLKTSSTYHTNLPSAREGSDSSRQAQGEADLDTLKAQQQELLDLQKHVQRSLANIQTQLQTKKKKKTNFGHLSKRKVIAPATTKAKSNNASFVMKRSQSSFGFGTKPKPKQSQNTGSSTKRRLAYRPSVQERKRLNQSVISTTSARRNRNARQVARDTSICGGQSFIERPATAAQESFLQPSKSVNKYRPTTPQIKKKETIASRLANVGQSNRVIKSRATDKRPSTINKPTKTPFNLQKELSDIKCWSTRVAKQLTSQNLIDLSNQFKLPTETMALLKSFCIILNSFRREEYRLPLEDFEQKGTVKHYLKMNSRSIPPELLSISTKASKENYSIEGLEIASQIFKTALQDITREKREIKVIWEMVSRVVNFFNRRVEAEEAAKAKQLRKQRNQSYSNVQSRLKIPSNTGSQTLRRNESALSMHNRSKSRHAFKGGAQIQRKKPLHQRMASSITVQKTFMTPKRHNMSFQNKMCDSAQRNAMLNTEKVDRTFHEETPNKDFLERQRLHNEAMLDELEDHKDTTLTIAQRHGVDLNESKLPVEEKEEEEIPQIQEKPSAELLCSFNNTQQVINIDTSMAMDEERRESSFEEDEDFRLTLHKCDTGKSANNQVKTPKQQAFITPTKEPVSPDFSPSKRSQLFEGLSKSPEDLNSSMVLNEEQLDRMMALKERRRAEREEEAQDNFSAACLDTTIEVEAKKQEILNQLAPEQE